MKKGFSTGWIALLLMAVGCNTMDDSGATGSAVLNNPPFERLTDSLHQYPADASLYVKRAALLSQRDLHDLANADLHRAWELKHDEPTALLYISNLFLTGKVKEAVGLLKQCKERFPQQPEFARRLSEAYLQNGQTSEALSLYNELITQDSTDFEAWYEQGTIMAQSRDTAKAIRALEKAYALQPLQTYGISLANLYAETRNRKALTVCDELIKKDTLQELTDAVFIKGIYYSNINEPDMALEQFENCIKRDWKFTEAYIEKGIILYKENNIDEALKTFALAANVSNTYPDAYYWMGRCFESIGKIAEAKDSYRRALAFDKGFSEARDGLNRLK